MDIEQHQRKVRLKVLRIIAFSQLLIGGLFITGAIDWYEWQVLMPFWLLVTWIIIKAIVDLKRLLNKKI